MLIKLLTGAALASVLVLSPLAVSAEPMHGNEPAAEHEHHGGDHGRRHHDRHHHDRHHHHHHHHND